MARRTVKSFEEIKNFIDFEEIERKKREEEARRPKTMVDFGFKEDQGNKALNSNKTKHRQKQYHLDLEEIEADEDEQDSFASLFGQSDSHTNKVLAKQKSRHGK